jgi:hypothetical protein
MLCVCVCDQGNDNVKLHIRVLIIFDIDLILCCVKLGDLLFKWDILKLSIIKKIKNNLRIRRIKKCIKTWQVGFKNCESII